MEWKLLETGCWALNSSSGAYLEYVFIKEQRVKVDK